MKTYYPNLLTRQRAMQMLNCTRTELEKLVQQNSVRTYKTSGKHNRYFRDDLTKYTTLTKQNNG
jgi:excisionase family DNA binding protein